MNNLSSGAIVGGFLLSILIIFIFLLITRTFWCWFFKINILVDLLQEISMKLSKSSNTNSPDEIKLKELDNKIDKNEKNYCRKCNKIIRLSYDGKCTFCGTELKTIE